MNADDLKELKELVDFLRESKIGEFELDRGEERVRIKFASEAGASATADQAQLQRLLSAIPVPPLVQSPPAVSGQELAEGAGLSSATSAAPAQGAEETGTEAVRSPMVGTFYESPSPGSPAFVKPGDQVEVGQVLCIIEAMKLMNEIESDVAGEIVSRVVTNGQPVEYGQALFRVRPR